MLNWYLVECKLSERSSEKPIVSHVLQAVEPAFGNIGLALQICFVPKGGCRMVSGTHCIANGRNQNATHTADCRSVGSVTHADNNEAFRTKDSTTFVEEANAAHRPMWQPNQRSRVVHNGHFRIRRKFSRTSDCL